GILAQNHSPMKQPAKQWIMFALRWGVAVVGIWWVIANMSLRDRVMILNEDNHPVEVGLWAPASEESATFVIGDPVSGAQREISRSEVVNRPDRKNVPLSIRTPAGVVRTTLLALDLTDNLKQVRRLLVSDPATGKGMWIAKEQVVGGYQLQVPRPRVDVGVLSMVKLADPTLLAGAVLIFPITFVVTSLRWNALLRVLGIRLTQARTFVLNMVGQFYSTFMPGSTGGDVLKAYYASKQTPHRTSAVISVLVDRVIGLLALVVMGGAMAGLQYVQSENRQDAASRACLRVAVGAGLIVAGTLATMVLFRRPVRRAIGLDYLLKRLPMQKMVQQAIHAMSIYRRRPGVVLLSLIGTFPVHITVVISAMLAGEAFKLPLPLPYYFVAVPVIVLSGAIPISPQGAGVMEFFAIQLTKQYGVTVSQAFALTMSIRLVQILWNLTGGVFVFRGGYHAPSETEQKELEAEEERGRGRGGSDSAIRRSLIPCQQFFAGCPLLPVTMNNTGLRTKDSRRRTTDNH
ncbi:MAG TPA: lysylphosphatidylglycerol synthase transmembrane domain-containing protein, partial [Tepidisphaeraceae bacterium]|nr:lysylphosphatidylglycerol synthase transmembrane domain-containing protein [Tepidisphaeraceae bacterium]